MVFLVLLLELLLGLVDGEVDFVLFFEGVEDLSCFIKWFIIVVKLLLVIIFWIRLSVWIWIVILGLLIYFKMIFFC